MICNNCGSQVEQNVGFCPKCGNPMNNNVNNVTTTNTNNQMYSNPVNMPVNNGVNQPVNNGVNNTVVNTAPVPVSNPVNSQVNNNYNTGYNPGYNTGYNTNTGVNSSSVPVNNNVNGVVNNGVVNNMAAPVNNNNNYSYNYSNPTPVNNMNYNQPYNNTVNNSQQFNNQPANNNGTKSNKPLIFALLGIAAVLLILVVVLFVSKRNDNAGGGDDGVLDSRTIMIYLCGSDLESQIALASSDLDSIIASEVDEGVNVVVYTGGAKKWYNYVSNQENAIYVLEDSGFVKKKTYDKTSMGLSSSLSTLLDYSYENYKADKYDLVMWNHGLGSLGISSDEQFGSDYLSLNELTEALSKSKFTGDNKLETVIFRSCLNSTLEMSSVFVPYSKYFVASEEVTWGGTGSKVLAFINDVTLEDTGVDVGKKFIASYEDSLETLASRYGATLDDAFPVSTYAVIDLSKINELENKLSIFFKSLNLNVNYNSIARVRSNLYQYASESGCNDYDTVDLYHLVNGLKSLSSTKADDVLVALDNAIVYNWSNNDFSNGLAVYFPYRSSSRVRNMHYTNYKNLTGLKDYYEFITAFDNLQKKSSNGSFSAISKEAINISVENKKVSLVLDDDNMDNYAKASYIIFEKVGTNYSPVFTSDTFELGTNKYTKDLDMNLIKVINNDNNTSAILNLNTNSFNNLYTDATVSNSDSSLTSKIYFKNLKISKVVESKTDSSAGIYLDINEYSSIKFAKPNYSVLNKGVVYHNWEETKVDSYFEVGSNYSFESVELDSNYYVMFKIYDVDNLYTYSDLIQIK